jgi:hypothetical protein
MAISLDIVKTGLARPPIVFLFILPGRGLQQASQRPGWTRSCLASFAKIRFQQPGKNHPGKSQSTGVLPANYGARVSRPQITIAARSPVNGA